MMRIVSVWLPLWPIERMRRVTQSVLPEAGKKGGPEAGKKGGPEAGRRKPPEPPFALVDSGPHGLTLTAVNEAVLVEGLRPGLSLADARAALPGLKTRPAEIERDRTALDALALWCGRYGPHRNTEGEDGLWIDITGVAHLFGGEKALLADLAARLSRFGLTARIGLADTSGAAFALARFAASPEQHWVIASPGETRGELTSLPVDALRLTPGNVVLLKRLGLRRIGQLYDLPRSALAQRFRAAMPTRGATTGIAGNVLRKREVMPKASQQEVMPKACQQAGLAAGVVLARLDQALGAQAEPRAGLAEPPVHLVRHAFAEPLISAEGVESAVALLAADLGRRLEASGEGGSHFMLSFYRTDGTSVHVEAGLSRPGRGGDHLMALLFEKIATIDAGFGIDMMTLAATRVEPISPRQGQLKGGGIGLEQTDPSGLIDRLSNRLGAKCVLRLAPTDSHIPERAERRIPALVAQRAETNGAAVQHRGRRPQFLLPRPEQIAVLAEVPEGPPLRFTWRRLTRRVVRAQGPERIEPEWWRAIGIKQLRQGMRPRDYYAIEDEIGARYWVFRAGLYGEESEASADEEEDADVAPGPPVWFLHGVLA